MGACNFDLCGHWRDELVKLEANLQELEEQCGPKDAPAASAAVWAPPAGGDLDPPLVEHAPLLTAPAGQPLRIEARVRDPSGVASLRLRYRHVSQYEDYAALAMQPTGRLDEYAATIAGAFLTPERDTMYYLEAIDGAGNGTIWPDFRREAPYRFVRLER
jgi:hypothetical protein